MIQSGRQLGAVLLVPMVDPFGHHLELPQMLSGLCGAQVMIGDHSDTMSQKITQFEECVMVG